MVFRYTIEKRLYIIQIAINQINPIIDEETMKVPRQVRKKELLVCTLLVYNLVFDN